LAITQPPHPDTVFAAPRLPRASEYCRSVIMGRLVDQDVHVSGMLLSYLTIELTSF
jgi:hypothetical protein